MATSPLLVRRIVTASILIVVGNTVVPLHPLVKAPDPLSGISRLAELLPDSFCPDRKFSGESLYAPATALGTIVSEVQLRAFELRPAPPFERIACFSSNFWRAPPLGS